jgi:hypothetical protein
MMIIISDKCYIGRRRYVAPSKSNDNKGKLNLIQKSNNNRNLNRIHRPGAPEDIHL